MAWVTPITSWSPSDTLADTDFERIEGNIDFLHTGLYPTASGTITLTLSGFSAATTVDAHYKKFPDDTGSAYAIVEVTFEQVFSASNSTSLLSTTAMPVGTRPTGTNIMYMPCPVFDNGNFRAGALSIASAGVFSWFLLNLNGTHLEYSGTFTSSGNKGFRPFTARYPII